MHIGICLSSFLYIADPSFPPCRLQVLLKGAGHLIPDIGKGFSSFDTCAASWE